MKKVTETIKGAITVDYEAGKKIMQLTKEYSLSKKTVADILKKKSDKYNKYLESKPGRYITPIDTEVYAKISKLWINGRGITEISNEVHKTRANVHRILYILFGKENIVKTRKIYTKSGRKWNLNEYYFETIDTEDKAYFLGLLYADGCVSGNHNEILLQLNYRDVELIEKFNIAIEYDRPITDIQPKIVTGFNKGNGGWRELMKGTTIASVRFKKYCIQQGLYPRKSLTLTFPTEEQVPKELVRHFIRGYFDGDGYVSDVKNKQAVVSFAGTKDVCDSIKTIITQETGVNVTVTYHNNIWYAKIAGRFQISKIYQWMYKDSSVYLNRKYIRFQEWLNYVKKRPVKTMIKQIKEV